LARCMACNHAAAAAQQGLPAMCLATARGPLALDVQESCHAAARAIQALGIQLIVVTGHWRGKHGDEFALFASWRTLADLGAVVSVPGNPCTCQVHAHVPTPPRSGGNGSA